MSMDQEYNYYVGLGLTGTLNDMRAKYYATNGAGAIRGEENTSGVITITNGDVEDYKIKNHSLQPIAFIDFTTKDDGAPPGTLDTSQVVDYHFNSTGREPVISNGRLIVNNQAGAGSGGLADYYQSGIGSPIMRVGVEFTMPSGSNDGNGVITYAAWDGVYEGTGNVPRSWVHMALVPGTGASGTAKFFVCDGAGHLFVVKEQTFKNPAADGVTPWVCESILDLDNGVAWNWLPDGSLMSVSDAELAAMCVTLGYTPFTFATLESKYIMCEHYCATGASAAKFPEYKSLYGETIDSEAIGAKSRAITPRSLTKIISKLAKPDPGTTMYAPTTQLSVATTTSQANVDSTNVRIYTTAGPLGKVIFEVTAFYEFSADDVLFWVLAGTATSTTRAAMVGKSGQKVLVSQVIEMSGFTPGQVVTEVLRHWTVSAGSATLKAGGTGGSMTPPVTIKATPV